MWSVDVDSGGRGHPLSVECATWLLGMACASVVRAVGVGPCPASANVYVWCVCKPLFDMRILLLCLPGARILCRACIFLATWRLRVPVYGCVLDSVPVACLRTSCCRGWPVGCCVLGMGCWVLGASVGCRLQFLIAWV